MSAADDSELTRRALLCSAVPAGGAAGAAATAATAQQNGGTVTVDMTDELVFDPEDIRIEPGTTVRWENVGTVGHSVTAYEDDIPEQAAFFASGGLAGESAARSAYPQRGDVAGGEAYEHTFEIEGEYDYFCIPHEAVGMLGTVLVTTEPPPTPEPLADVPDSLRQLGIAAGAAMVLILGLTLFFVKYGGDYGE